MGLFFGKRKKKKDEEKEFNNMWNGNYRLDEFEKLENYPHYTENEAEEEDSPDDVDDTVYLTNKEEKLLFVEDCCDQILEASKRAADAKKEYKAVNGYLEDIRIIREQDEKAKDELIYITRRIKNLKNDKESYRNFGTKIPEQKYRYIQANEKNMQSILKELHDDENYMQSLKTDLHNIEGEKAALNYEKKECEKKLQMAGKIAVLVLAATMLAMGPLFYFHLNSEYDFTIGIMITVALAAVCLAGVVVGYQNSAREIKVIERKINKAVRLLNKYRLLYVNVKNRIDYVYDKLEIHSAYELNNYWRLYLTAKKEQEAYTKMTDELYQAERQFQDHIHTLRLYDESVWSFQMDAILDENVMDDLVNNLNRRKKGLRKTLDYNKKRSEKYKQKVKNLIKDEPQLASDILKIVEEKENAIV